MRNRLQPMRWRPPLPTRPVLLRTRSPAHALSAAIGLRATVGRAGRADLSSELGWIGVALCMLMCLFFSFQDMADMIISSDIRRDGLLTVSSGPDV